MRSLVRLACVCAALVLMTMAWPTGARADDGLGLDLRAAGTADPMRLVFVVGNSTADSCALSTTAEGTVQVVSVRRDGQELTPVLGRSFYLDGLGKAIAKGLVTAKPGSTVDVVMTGYRTGDGGTVLRSVAVTADGGGLDALWPVGTPGRYEVTANYTIPAMAAEFAGAQKPCAGTTATRTVAFTVGLPAPQQRRGFPWLWLAAGIGALLLIGALVVILARRRHRPAAALLVLVMVVATGAVAGPRAARADVKIDPKGGIPVPGDFEKAVNDCFAGFAAPGGDPSGIMKRLKDPKTPRVTIIPTTGESGAFDTSASKDGKGSSTVTWNPTDASELEDGLPRDPCSSLYHELNHADDISRDTVPQGYCGDTGIRSAEVKATFAENRYRRAKKLKPRTEYQGKKLPKSYDECKKKPKKPKGPIKLCEGLAHTRCGKTHGDPHLTTFDLAYYDFMAVGEFVLVRSTDAAAAGGPLEVQVRQSPLDNLKTISVTMAVAFRLGSDRVEMSIVDNATQVRIGGEIVDVQRGEKTLPGGGVIARRESDLRGDGYDVRWPDGSAATVDGIGRHGYRILVKLATPRAGKVEGLLGDFDGDPSNDIAPAKGAALSQPVAFSQLYPSYADSWRVAQNGSLFTYAAGQSTETFTDRSFPEKPIGVADLDPARRAEAETICRWATVTDPWQFIECVFDVGVSGRTEFAVSSAGTEVAAPPEAAPITAPPLVSGTLTAGSGKGLTFAGRAGQAVFVDATAPTVEDSCSPYRLVAPGGKNIGFGCNINGAGHIDRTELPADGQYTVLLQADGAATGRAMVRVYAAKDIDSTIAPNGAEVSAVIEQPGAVARYKFSGTAGQRVFIDVVDSSLPDQCSPLELRDASDKQIASGCVINGIGDIEGTVLPADGVYTAVVDPRDRTIGYADLRLFAAPDETGTITVGGPPVTAMVSQPGSVMQYRFTATAGTSVRIEATDATLPDQCSPLKLLDPSGEHVASGCVINGSGDIGRATLPVAGTYTVVVDPSGNATGSVTLSVRKITQ